MSLKQFPRQEVERRIAAAQAIHLDLGRATTRRIHKLVTDYSASIGCPKEFFLLPLQSISAHFIGPKASVKVHDSWKEPIILWSVVMAHKGQKKSPALGCFNKQLTEMEEMLTSTDSEHPPQIFVEHFSFEELHYTMKRNDNRVLGLYDELSLLYEQLDRYKAGQADRKTILTLINGGCWRQNFRSSTSTMKSTWFNLTGFVQPATVVMCNSKDDDGLMDRQLFACPNEIHYDYDEYRSLPESTPCLKEIFKEIDEAHPLSSTSTYTLQEDAKLEFIAIHDELNQRIREQHSTDHDRKSVIGKGHGQLVRITCAHWALEQALVRIEQRQQNIPVSPWSFQIPKDLILRAKILLDYFIEVKLALGPPPHSMEESDDETPYDYHRIRRILELPTPNVTPSQITQAHIPSRTDGRYTRESALKLMRDIELLGLGELSDSSGAG